MLRVGLTGGIGSGKSAVSSMLAGHGAVIVDADRIAREVVAPGTPGLDEVVQAFGDHILDAGGALDRPALGSLVFGDDEMRRRLEQIIHPRVRARAAEIESAAPQDAVVVHDIPLLVETGQGEGFDVVIVVDAPVETQVERLASARAMSTDDARARIAAQATREQRTGVADFVVDNTGSLTDLAAQVDRLWKELQASGR